MNNIEKVIEKLKSQRDMPGLNKSTKKRFARKQNIEHKKNPSSMASDNNPILIDEEYLKEKGFLSAQDIHTKKAEEYRIIKRPILINAFDKQKARIEKANIVGLISALPGEGKTYTAMNLALSMAIERNTTVLLIDADVTKPSLSHLLNVRGDVGLLDYLEDENMDISSVIRHTSMSRLRFIPAGKQNEHAAELLASRRMSDFVEEISARYADRIILFDTPPIMATSHSTILANLVGQILMVVEAGGTLQDKIIEAISKLDNNKVIGLILNKSRSMFTTEYYGSYGDVPPSYEENKEN